MNRLGGARHSVRAASDKGFGGGHGTARPPSLGCKGKKRSVSTERRLSLNHVVWSLSLARKALAGLPLGQFDCVTFRPYLGITPAKRESQMRKAI
jgi:hypothetical protein